MRAAARGLGRAQSIAQGATVSHRGAPLSMSPRPAKTESNAAGPQGQRGTGHDPPPGGGHVHG